MTCMDVRIEGEFLDEAREAMTKSLDLSMGSASSEVSIDPGSDRCTFCDENQDDVEGKECTAADDGKHVFEAPSLAWADRVKVSPDTANDELKVSFRPTGKTGRVNITFGIDAETGEIRLVVDTEMVYSERSLDLRQVQAKKPNGQRTEYRIKN